MFGIGLPELAVLAFIGVIVFGPDKLPELARQAAHLVNRAKQMADGARDQLRSELGPEYADLEMRDLDPRELVRRHLTAAFDSQDDESDKNDSETSATHSDETTDGPGDLEWLASTPPPPSLLRRSRRARHTSTAARPRHTHMIRK